MEARGGAGAGAMLLRDDIARRLDGFLWGQPRRSVTVVGSCVAPHLTWSRRSDSDRRPTAYKVDDRMFRGVPARPLACSQHLSLRSGAARTEWN